MNEAQTHLLTLRPSTLPLTLPSLSKWGQAGIRVGKPTANVTIINITTEGRGGIAIGSEMSGGVENVTIRDVKLLGERTVHMKTTKALETFIYIYTYMYIYTNL